MPDAIRQLRAEARQFAHGKAPKAVRYPVAFRGAVAAVVRRQLDDGVALHRVAGQLGLPGRSLARWLQQSAPPVLRPVTVRPEPVPVVTAAIGLVLITPRGVRVEGLDRDTLLAVLRRLG